MPPIVVKLGGSLYNTPELNLWLKALASYSEQQAIVIVPGGGPFANLVRDAQGLHRFDDKTAHHMAIVAMKQFGLLLSSLEPKCQPLSLNKNESAALSVWLPEDSLLQESSIEQSWGVSSDSLALWLANTLSASQLLLIKQVQPLSRSIKELSKEQCIDHGFSSFFKSFSGKTKIVHSQNYLYLAEHMSDDSLSLSL